jgi:hypothetical protein
MGADELNDSRAESVFNDVGRKLNKLRGKKKLRDFFLGILHFLILLFGAGAAFILFEMFFWFPPVVRCVLLSLFILLLCMSGILWVVRPLYSLVFRPNQPSDVALAVESGKCIPALRDRLADAIEVYENRERDARHTSAEMALSALIQADSEIQNRDLSCLVSFKNLNRPAWHLVMTMAVGFAALMAQHRSAGQAVVRWIHPLVHFNRPAPFQLVVSPGTVRVLQGEKVRISVSFIGKWSAVPVLVIEPEGEKSYSIRMTAPFEHEIESVKKNTGYFVYSGKVRSDNFVIEVTERPMVRILQLTLHYPAYSKLGLFRMEPNVGDVEALSGTRVEMKVAANRPLRKAKVVFDNGTTIDLKPERRNARGHFVMIGNGWYQIDLEDTFGERNINPIRYAIRVKQDEFPFIRIVTPEKDSDLNQSMVVHVGLEAEDDFGISKCSLGYFLHQKTDSPEKSPDTLFCKIPLGEKPSLRLFTTYTWDLGSMRLLPEETVCYFVEATDNDGVSGPKSTRSEMYTLHFPSIEDIYREVEKEQADQISELNDMRMDAESFQTVIRKMNDELKTDQALAWEGKETIEEKAERQEEQIQRLGDLSDRLENLIESMDENNILNEQTLQKYQELQALYKEMDTPEWREALQKMQDAMARINQEEIRKAMEGLQISQEALLKSLERTLSLLKRIRIEQKMDELIRRIQDLSKNQEEVNGILEKGENKASVLAAQEASIQEQAGACQSDIQKLKNDMQAAGGMPMESMENAVESFSSPDLSVETAAMEQALMKNNRDGALNQGRQIAQQMRQAGKKLEETRKKMNDDERARVARAMRDLSMGILELSQEQESLNSQSGKGVLSQGAAEEKQQSISEALDQKADTLYRLSQKTFLVSPEMGKYLGEAKLSMQRALDGMKNSDMITAGRFQQKSVGALNQATIALLKGLEESGRGSGSGMESFFLQLQGMGAEQAALNQALSDLLGRGRLSMEEQAGMARLAAEQESIKERLRQMIRGSGNRSDVAGDLSQLVKDMEQAVRDMQMRKADRQTVQNQERILSRLLDAQRSLNRRDFSAKRQARTAQDIVRQSPASMQNSTLPDLDRMRKDVLEAAREGYTKEYLDLIEKYYNALIRANSN